MAGKTRILFQLAAAAKDHPDELVRDVIFPVVGLKTLDDLVKESEASEGYETQVRLVARASYSHHYRRIVPVLLEVLAFHSNNALHRPVMDALDLLRKYRDRKTKTFSVKENVLLEGVVKDDWQELLWEKALLYKLAESGTRRC